MENKTGLYIHIPFCVRKCNYCAFLSFDADPSLRKEYTGSLINEIRFRAEALSHPELDTVYVGGGTPTVLDVSQMRDIMHAVDAYFRVKPGAEITIEANPGTLGRGDCAALAKLQAYRSLGFSRISMGVQSMNNDRLRFMGRIHTAEDVIRDMELIRRKGFDNVNLDLIFSLPGSSTADALDDLERIIELEPEHISCYSLQIEEGTVFARMAESHEIREVPDEEDRRTYHAICARLKDAGYEHYEISNFARLTPSPYRSRHNSLYWDMSEYIGIGLGASGFVKGRRYKNITNIVKYIRFYNDPEGTARAGALEQCPPPLDEDHQNSAFDNISEAVFTGLRRAGGITYEDAIDAYYIYVNFSPDGSALKERPAGAAACRAAFWDIFADAQEEARRYSDRGLLIIDDEGIRLTEQGIDISNSIMSLFV